MDQLQAGHDDLRQQVRDLQAALATLTEQFRSLRDALGVKE
jgi:prefoldin subunit 5